MIIIALIKRREEEDNRCRRANKGNEDRQS